MTIYGHILPEQFPLLVRLFWKAIWANGRNKGWIYGLA